MTSTFSPSLWEEWEVVPELRAETLHIGSNGRMIFANNLDDKVGIPAIQDNSVSLTFTSPPYWNFVDYEGKSGIGYRESYQDYLDALGHTFRAVWEKTIPGGVLVINASNMKARKSVEGKSFIYPLISDIIRGADEAGFVFFDEIVWVKCSVNRTAALNGRPLFGSYPFPGRPKMLDSIFENVMVFTKPGKRTKLPKEVKELSRVDKDDWWVYTKGVWYIPPDKDPYHPATFPMEMAERIVKLYSFVGDLVLDPFAGTGTTVIAAEKNERQGLGLEIAPEYKKATLAKVRKWLNNRATG